MILVDTPVWIDHLRLTEPRLVELLERDLVVVHPMVIAELALGSIAERGRMLSLLRDLRSPPVLTDAEVLAMIDAHALQGRGIGVVDAHLLGSALLGPDAKLWTRDKRMRAACLEIGAAAVPWE